MWEKIRSTVSSMKGKRMFGHDQRCDSRSRSSIRQLCCPSIRFPLACLNKVRSGRRAKWFSFDGAQLRVNAVHLELILQVRPGVDCDRLGDRLRAQGFDPQPMRVGILLSAELSALRKLLPTLTGTEAVEIAVPEELKDFVLSIQVFKPRSFRSS